MRFTDKRGFSLVEMLIATLILSLVMVIVTSGAAVAQKLYRKTMAKADAQMVLSQIERYLRDDLSFADECKINAEGAVTSYRKNGFWHTLAKRDDDFLYRTFSADGQTIYEPLSTNNSARLETIFVSLPTITYVPDENCFRVADLCVKLEDETTVVAGSDNETTPYLIIRALNAVKAETQ